MLQAATPAPAVGELQARNIKAKALNSVLQLERTGDEAPRLFAAITNTPAVAALCHANHMPTVAEATAGQYAVTGMSAILNGAKHPKLNQQLPVRQTMQTFATALAAGKAAAAATPILGAVAGSISDRKLAGLTGVHRQNLSAQRKQLVEGMSPVAAAVTEVIKPHRKMLTEAEAAYVVEWGWEKPTRESPKPGDTVTMRDGTVHHMRLLECSVTELFEQYCREHPAAPKISESTFQGLRPRWVHATSTDDLVTCCCL